MNGTLTVPPSKMAQLWQEPSDLEQRGLFYGRGGAAQAPDSDGVFEFVKEKESGTQPGYDVRDALGREWSVKLGVEARTEVVVSRLVWSVGYHQPIVYYLPRWTLVRGGERVLQPAGRFRLEQPAEQKRSEWSWVHNPFLGTRELAGLFVLMVMVNNWDIKSEQNAVYEVARGSDGASGVGDAGDYRYLVRDLGASLGRTEWLIFGTKDDSAGFARESFIEGVASNRVVFAYDGAWREPRVHRSVRPSDVRWICGLLGRLSAAQWRDAFRAGGYSDSEAAPFIRRLRDKIAEGLAISDWPRSP
ncbi:MAG: hypothetical protein ACT4R6_13000 [Gemmatimonadaceae bacterium]